MTNIENWTGERLETFVSNETMVEHLHRYSIVMPFIKGKCVLDIACGEGYGSNLIAQSAEQVYGVDIDEKVIEDAKLKYIRNNLAYINGSAHSIPLNDNSIDVVISFETIEHHDKHEEMLLEIKRVLKTDGLLVMSSPEKKTDVSFNPYHIKELTSIEFKSLINKHFVNASFYNQKIIMGSLIVPESNFTQGFETHQGDFKQLKSSTGLKNSVFNICIASDVSYPTAATSFFEASEVMINNITSPYRNSKIYKLISYFKSLVSK